MGIGLFFHKKMFMIQFNQQFKKSIRSFFFQISIKIIGICLTENGKSKAGLKLYMTGQHPHFEVPINTVGLNKL